MNWSKSQQDKKAQLFYIKINVFKELPFIERHYCFYFLGFKMAILNEGLS